MNENAPKMLFGSAQITTIVSFIAEDIVYFSVFSAWKRLDKHNAIIVLMFPKV